MTSKRVELRAKTKSLKRWRALAELHGLTLSEWIRRRCNDSSRPQIKAAMR